MVTDEKGGKYFDVKVISLGDISVHLNILPSLDNGMVINIELHKAK